MDRFSTQSKVAYRVILRSRFGNNSRAVLAGADRYFSRPSKFHEPSSPRRSLSPIAPMESLQRTPSSIQISNSRASAVLIACVIGSTIAWTDSPSRGESAIATFNEKTRTWHISAKGQKYGFATSGKGTLRQIDDDTLEWTWKEYDRFGLILLADMKGISRRK